MLCYRKHSLRMAELWYDDTPPHRGVDIVIHVQAPLAYPGVQWDKKHTIILNLTKSEEVLFSEMRKSDRIKIRNAQEKDNICCKIEELPNEVMRNRFYEFYDRFAHEKGLSLLDRGRMEQMASKGMLLLSLAHEAGVDPLVDPLVFHALLVYKGRTRALYSASVRLEPHNMERHNLVGRANRLLHWDEILWSRTKGLSIYDLGGWYGGADDAQRLGINRFKEGFGGVRVEEYEAMKGVTLIGKLAVFLWKRLKRD